MVFLIGVMLLIAVPKVREVVLSDPLNTAARRLVGAARELRSVAVRDQVDQILQLDLGARTYWVYSPDMSAEKKDNLKKQASRIPGDVKIVDVFVPGRSKQTAGEVSIRFFNRGYAQPAVIHLSDQDRYVTLVIHPFLNTVDMHDQYLDFWQAG